MVLELIFSISGEAIDRVLYAAIIRKSVRTYSSVLYIIPHGNKFIVHMVLL